MIQRRIVRILSIAAGLLMSGVVSAASGSLYPMESVDPDGENLPSLQNGMKLYVNYCLGCHTLRFQRYERTVDDLAIPHAVALDTVVFTGQKIGELMVNGMSTEKAKAWFGAPPPDLTMVTRVRGPEWVYNYLKTFYIDESRPFGVNNKVFENVGMPHVLLPLQGIQRNGCVQMPVILPHGGEKRDPLVPGKAITEEKCDQLYVEEGTGSMSATEYDAAVYDLVNFLHYVAEPSRLERHRIGIYVLLFLILLGVFTYLLNREYWKDVH
jgi:cytochrome c1